MASLSSVADITPPAAVAGRGNGIALSALLDARRIWKGQSAVPAGASLPTGHARLDALLPGGGWPEHALSEILHARDGVGELQLLMPTLARLTQAQRRVVLVGVPYVPYPQAWLAAAVDLRHLVLLQASGRLELLDDGERSAHLGEGWRFHFSEGHTPGQMLPEIAMPDGPVVFSGDLIPGAPWVHLPLTMGYDRFPEGLIEEKERLLDSLIARNGRLVFTHDPCVAMGRVRRDEQERYSLYDTLERVENLEA